MWRVLLLLSVLCIGTLGGCTTTSSCPPTNGNEHFKTTGFSTSTARATVPDSSRIRPDLSPLSDDTLESGQLALRMVPEKVLYSQAASPSPSFHLLPAAHACSPEIPQSEETITDLRIYSDQSFRDRAPGDNLSTYFDVVALNEADYGYRRFNLDSFLSMTPRAADELILLLDARPDTTAQFRFTVEYEQEGPGLDDYQFTTEPVVLPADPS